MEAYELDKIKVLATSFRGAIEIAKDAGEFDNDFAFPRFPKGCCGDTSDLLAEYLAQHDIYTYYVCGQKGTQSHAWLVLVNTVTVTTDNSDADRKYKSLISVYNEDNDVMLLRKYYNLKDAIIIDITGDQFTNQKCFLYYNIPVYVGFLDDFLKTGAKRRKGAGNEVPCRGFGARSPNTSPFTANPCRRECPRPSARGISCS